MATREFNNIVLLADPSIAGSDWNSFEVMDSLTDYFKDRIGGGGASQTIARGKFVLSFWGDQSVTPDEVTRALTAKTQGGHFTFRQASPEALEHDALKHLGHNSTRRVFEAPTADYPMRENW